uniref:CB068 protein n=1 Tax=Accipiter nisus TaxID=211598 RepID=A0A8B9MHH3_9AVES
MEAAAGWRCRPGGRLDMSHGFVRHIRRNQIARDAYERAVRQARGRARGRLTTTPPRPRRPDQQVYRPRRPGERRGGAPKGGRGSTQGGGRGPPKRCLGGTGHKLGGGHTPQGGLGHEGAPRGGGTVMGHPWGGLGHWGGGTQGWAGAWRGSPKGAMGLGGHPGVGWGTGGGIT